MRNLTLTRNKSFVGCLAADQVYVRDVAGAELMIAGVPCRKLGTLKNGETKTFQIGNEEQRIFLIADKASKNYCNASLTVPAGTEDVAYSGKHQFSLGSNPFVFDGVELTAEEKALQQKNKRKGSVIYILAIIAGLIIGVLASRGFFDLNKSKPKDFNKGDFSITLTNEFEPVTLEESWAAYESNKVGVFVIRDDAALFEDITVEEYAELSLEANDREGLQVHKEDKYVWISYEDTADGSEYYYFVALYKGKDAYWAVNFVTPKKNADKFQDTFKKWAESVAVGANAG